MAGSPTSNREYIEQVQQQADRQSEEHVSGHKEMKEQLESEKQYYSQKLQFYSLLLVVMVLSYLGVKVLPLVFGWETKEDS